MLKMSLRKLWAISADVPSPSLAVIDPSNFFARGSVDSYQILSAFYLSLAIYPAEESLKPENTVF